MNKLFLLSVPLFSVALVGCTQKPEVSIEKTQLQIREFQTRTYETADSKEAMKAILNVLQDDGYIVKNAVADLGLITATKEADVEDGGEKFWNTFWLGYHATWKKNSLIEASCNITNANNKTKIRANFQVKVVDNKGGTIEVKQVDDEKFYQTFFSKVDKGLYLHKEKL
jgi:hypothetical protein